MTGDIKFGTGQQNRILEDLEEFRKNRQVDRLIERALQGDSNLLIFEEVLSCINNGPVSPTTHKELFAAVRPALIRSTITPKKEDPATERSRQARQQMNEFVGQPVAENTKGEDDALNEGGLFLARQTSLARFVFVEDALPGNMKATSFCTSLDGSLLAYMTMAASPLQKSQGKYVRQCFPERQGTSSLKAQRPKGNSPMIVNVISLDPYDYTTLSVNNILPDLESSGMELVGVDRNHLYAIQSKDAQKRLIRIGVHDGALLGTFDLGDSCGTFFLSAEGRHAFFIDTASATLNRLELSDGSLVSYPLSLPPRLSAKDILSLVLNPGGTSGVAIVGPPSDANGVLMAIIRLPQEDDREFVIRWLKRKEVWLDGSFIKVRFSFDPATTAIDSNPGIFYLVDVTGTIYVLPMTSLMQPKLREIDPTHLLRAIPSSKGGKKATYPLLAVGSERPLLVVYEKTSEEIRIWDTSTNLLLVSLACPFPIDSMELVAHDTLLVTKSRSVKGPRDRLAVTFLDFLFLAGQSPKNLPDECLPLLEPLEAWAPDNSLLGFIRRLAEYNSKNSQERSV